MVKLPFMKNRLTIKSDIPFGPFLILGTALVFFWNVQVIDVNTFLNLFT